MNKQNKFLVGLITIFYRPKTGDLNRFWINFKTLNFPYLQLVFVVYGPLSNKIRELLKNIPQAVVIQRESNFGTARGWNLGIQQLLIMRAKYIGIWNLDVKLAPNCMKCLLTTMEGDSAIGASSPILFYSDQPNKVQMYGGSIDVLTGLGRHDYNGVTDLSTLPPIRDAQYIDGGTMLIRTDVLRKIGGFDEKLFMYYEDSDLCLRIQRIGYRTVAVRDAWAWHYHRENKGMYPTTYELFYINRNRFYFVWKHGGKQAWNRLVVQLLLKTPRQLLFYLRRSQFIRALALIHGILYGITGQMGKRGWIP